MFQPDAEVWPQVDPRAEEFMKDFTPIMPMSIIHFPYLKSSGYYSNRKTIQKLSDLLATSEVSVSPLFIQRHFSMFHEYNISDMGRDLLRLRRLVVRSRLKVIWTVRTGRFVHWSCLFLVCHDKIAGGWQCVVNIARNYKSNKWMSSKGLVSTDWIHL